jgi:hypothetical protein
VDGGDRQATGQRRTRSRRVKARKVQPDVQLLRCMKVANASSRRGPKLEFNRRFWSSAAPRRAVQRAPERGAASKNLQVEETGGYRAGQATGERLRWCRGRVVMGIWILQIDNRL